jgi:MFS family permease
MTEKKHRSGWTLFALGLGYLVDQGEDQSMGVLQPVIMRLWNVGLDMFGWMDSLRILIKTISAPLWGYAADRYSRRKVLFFGTGIWGIWTLAVGFAGDFNSLFIIRIISGLGLGCLMPATFSLLGDHFPQSKRGRALGVVGLVGLLGNVLGVLAMGFVANEQSWRWGFWGLGIASIISGIVIWFAVEELPRGSAEPELANIITFEDNAKNKVTVRDMLNTLKIPTVWAAILQGITGTVPWVVMAAFIINWMVTDLGYSNEITFSHPKGSAPLIFAAIIVGAAISNLMGGFIGDFAERINPKYGRTVIGQFSVLVGVPLMYIFLTQAINWPFMTFFGFAFCTALLIAWPGRGAKEPMMQAVVPPEMRSSAYSVVSFVEGGLSAFGSVIAGSIAAQSGLTTALLWMIPFPWLICGIFFSIFYFTYPKDAAKVRQQMTIRREELIIQHMQDK